MVYTIDRIRNLIKQNAGEKPLVFLDTGAIIDFEREIKLWKLKNSSYGPSQWYEELTKNLTFYVTEGAIKEITRHCEHNQINGRPEIAPSTLEIMNQFHSDYCNFLKETSNHNPVNFDKIRWNVYWACKSTFPDTCKKGSLDLMSCSDRGIVETAIWSRYALNSEKKPLFTYSVILSPDEHLSGTVRTLINKNPEVNDKIGTFDYDKIRLVNSR